MGGAERIIPLKVRGREKGSGGGGGGRGGHDEVGKRSAGSVVRRGGETQETKGETLHLEKEKGGENPRRLFPRCRVHKAIVGTGLKTGWGEVDSEKKKSVKNLPGGVKKGGEESTNTLNLV